MPVSIASGAAALRSDWQPGGNVLSILPVCQTVIAVATGLRWQRRQESASD
jgi:hypothetical protein